MTLRTTDFDAIAACAPLNREASVVRDGSGETYDKPHASFAEVNRWDAPPEMRPVATLHEIYPPLIGQRFGRLVVLGVWAGGNPKKKPHLVCRCDCGYYEGRRLKGLLGLARDGQEAECSHCAQTTYLRKLAAKPSTKAARKVSDALLDALAENGRPA